MILPFCIIMIFFIIIVARKIYICTGTSASDTVFVKESIPFYIES